MGGTGRRLPRLHHLCDASNWPLIQRDGLLSTRTLVDRAGLSGAARDAVLRHRRESVRLPGGALVRDQWCLPPAALVRCLQDGLTPQDWYDRLNGLVFFWADAARVRRLADTYRRDPSVLLTLDGERLLQRHGDRAVVTRFNTGYALRRAKARSLDAFTPYADWLNQGWAPVEVAVEGGVPDLADYLLDATPIGPPGVSA